MTHDRALLDAVGTRTVAVEDYTLHSYVGGWAEYARVREERKALGLGNGPPPPARERTAVPSDARRPDGMAAAPAARPPAAKPKGPSKNRQKEQARLEAAIERAEAEVAAVEEELADPAAWATPYESAKSQARHTAVKRAVEDAYAALEAFEAGAAQSAQA